MARKSVRVKKAHPHAAVANELETLTGQEATAQQQAVVPTIEQPQAAGFTPQTGFTVSGSLAEGSSITVSDTQTRFGASGPNVLIYADWHDGGTVGTPIPLNDCVVGEWTAWAWNQPVYRAGKDGGRSMSIYSSTGFGDWGIAHMFNRQNITPYSEWFQAYHLYHGNYYGSPVANQMGPCNFKKVWHFSSGSVHGAGTASDVYPSHGTFGGPTHPINSATANTVTLGGEVRADGSYVGSYMRTYNPDQYGKIVSWINNVVTLETDWATIPTAGGNAHMSSGDWSNIQTAFTSNTSGHSWMPNIQKAAFKFGGWMHFQEHLRTNLDSPTTLSSYVHQVHTTANGGCVTRTLNNHESFAEGRDQYWEQANVPGFLANFFITSEAVDMRYDDFYLAVGPNAAKRFVIGTSATFLSATDLYICLATSWSGGSVVANLPYVAQGETLVGKYLFYVDGDNAPTLVGEFT